MTLSRLELEARRSYLELDLAVWRGRLAKMPGFSLYDDHDLRKELGKMRGELERIKFELASTPVSEASPIDRSENKLGCGGKRRVKQLTPTN